MYMFLVSGETFTPIGCSTSCSLDLSADAIEKSKRGQGSWRTYRPGRKAWSMSCSGFYFDHAAPTNFMRGREAVGTEVTVAITVLARELVEAGIDLSTATPSASHTLVGQAVIADCQYSGGKGSIATYSIKFAGSGSIDPI